MTRIHAFEGGAERANLDRNGDCRRQNLITDATRGIEKHEARAGNWAYSNCRSWRELVRHRIEWRRETFNSAQSIGQVF